MYISKTIEWLFSWWIPEFKRGSCLFWSLYYCRADSKLHEKKFLCHWSIVWSKKKVWIKYVFDKLFQVFFKNFKSKMCKRHDNDFTILLAIEKSKGNNVNFALSFTSIMAAQYWVFVISSSQHWIILNIFFCHGLVSAQMAK